MNAIINNRQVRLNLRSGEIFMQNRNFKGCPWEVKSGAMDMGYRRLRIGNKLYLYHRVIYKVHNPEWDIEDGSTDNSIDHINGTTTDNQITNLRNVTHQQNLWNYTKAKGYSWRKDMNKWQTVICVNHNHIHLGLYDLEADARNAYLEAKKIYHIID